MDCTKTVLVLTAANTPAEDACKLEHNASSLVPQSQTASDSSADAAELSRECTPVVDPSTYELRITLDKLPIDPHRGYVFGKDAERCDILVNHKGVS